MKKLLSKFRIVVPVLVCVFAFTTLLLTGCKEEPPHIHRLEQVEGKVATCTETGKMKHYHCTLCNKNYLTEEAKEEVSEEDLIIAVDEDNHNYDFTTADYDFHLKAGSETDYECTATVSCSRNPEHTKFTETVNATVQVTEPECTTAGEKIYTATFENQAFGANGVVSKTEPISALGHNYGTLITEVPATCLAKGTKAHYHCDRCNKDFLQQDGVVATAKDLTIEKSSHSMTRHERVEATCVNPGNIEYWHCSSCDKNYTDENGENEAETIVIPALGHNYLKEDETFNYVYDYTNSRYVAKCTRCNHTDSTRTQTAGVEGYPYLVNNENTLLSAVENGGYIKLADNIAINGVIIISKDVNIDLNEKTISYTQTVADSVKINGTRKSYCMLNFTNGSSVVSNGCITYNVKTEEKVSQGRVISIENATQENDARLTLQGLTITSALRGVMVFDNSQVTIQDCNITSSQDTISGNNTYGPTSKKLIVNIKDSSITSTNLTAVFMPSYMTLNIENSHITGKTSAIYAMMGVIDVDATSTLSSTRETFVARQDAPVSAEDNSNQLTNSGPGDESYDGATIVLRTNYYYDSKAKTNELTLNISDWSKVIAISGEKAVVYNFAEDSSYITTAKNDGNLITNQFAEVCNKLANLEDVKYFLYVTEEVYNEKTEAYENKKVLVELTFYNSYDSISGNISEIYWLFKRGNNNEGYSFIKTTVDSATEYSFATWEQRAIEDCGGENGNVIAFSVNGNIEKIFEIPTSGTTLINGIMLDVVGNDYATVMAFSDGRCMMVIEQTNGDFVIQGLYEYTISGDEGDFVTVTVGEDSYRYFLLDNQQSTIEEYVCKDSEGNYYTSLENAIGAIENEITITLLRDVALQQKLSISSSQNYVLTLDLGGHTINGAMTSGSMIHVKGCNLTITNGNIVSANAGVGVIRVQGREGADSASTMTDPVKVNTKLILDSSLNITSKSYCLFIFGSGAVVETSANLTNNSEEANVPAVIQTNGNSGSEIGSLTINGGTITHNTDVAMYLPAAGNYTINGGTITGSTAVYVKSGVLTINGGTLKATANKADFAHNGNGCYYTGDALVIEACNYPGGVPTANIYGGTFIIADEKAKQIGVYNYAGYEAKINNKTDIKITPESLPKQS